MDEGVPRIAVSAAVSEESAAMSKASDELAIQGFQKRWLSVLKSAELPGRKPWKVPPRFPPVLPPSEPRVHDGGTSLQEEKRIGMKT